VVGCSADNLRLLSKYCDEFLVHGVDVEGKRCGIEEDLVRILGKFSPIPVTYAGGVRSIEDMELVNRLGMGKVKCLIGD
jgi:phosphoribosylformimino-5-aminoimidazole carboxamide ribotide isomerase